MVKAVIYDRYGNIVEDDDIVPEGGTLRVPIPFMDALSAATRRVFAGADAALPVVHDGLGNPAGHRAGFVFGPAELRDDAAAAYAERSALLNDAWRSPSAQSRSAPRQGKDDCNDAGGRGDKPATRDAAAAAYAAYVARISNAWRAGG
jgi:hypothetical protein